MTTTATRKAKQQITPPPKKKACETFDIHVARLLEVKGPGQAGCQELLFPEAMLQGKLRKMRLKTERGGKKQPSTPQNANGWKTGAGGGPDGWHQASLVAESVPYIHLESRPITVPTPYKDRRTVLVLLADFFSSGGVLSSRTAGTGVKADKHWQNFKNCCHSPLDVHYVSGALRFAA